MCGEQAAFDGDTATAMAVGIDTGHRHHGQLHFADAVHRLAVEVRIRIGRDAQWPVEDEDPRPFEAIALS